MYFDTHSHTHFAAFAPDLDEVMARAASADVWMVNVGTSLGTSKSAAELAGKHAKGVYASIGLHPGHTWHEEKDEEESTENKQEVFDPQAYAALINDKVVAVGEIGLDYYRLPNDSNEADIAKDLQKQAFISQLKFAQDHKLPVIIHCRAGAPSPSDPSINGQDAYMDTLQILKSGYKGTGIIHSYTGDWETAKKFLDLGFYVALNGILTFDKTGRLAEVCKKLPSGRILAETDAPYLAPAPYRGKRNEPSYVKEIVRHMAGLRGENEPEFAETIFSNALAAFRLPSI